MRGFPQLAGLPGDGAGEVGAAARLRPADGGSGHQRDAGEGRGVPAQVRAALRGEAGVRPAQGSLDEHGHAATVRRSIYINRCQHSH